MKTAEVPLLQDHSIRLHRAVALADLLDDLRERLEGEDSATDQLEALVHTLVESLRAADDEVEAMIVALSVSAPHVNVDLTPKPSRTVTP